MTDQRRSGTGWAVITGASSGLGVFFAEQLAKRGMSLVRLSHAVLPGMLARGRGGILNVASTIAFQPAPYPSHLRRLKGVRAVVQPGPVGGDPRFGGNRDGVVPGAHPDRIR